MKDKIVSVLPIIIIVSVIVIIGVASISVLRNIKNKEGNKNTTIDIAQYPHITVKKDGKYAFIKDNNDMIIIVQELNGKQKIIGVMDPKTNPVLILPISKYKQESDVVEQFNKDRKVLGRETKPKEPIEPKVNNDSTSESVSNDNEASDFEQFFQGKIRSDKVIIN